ncbi:hypothetical protein O0S10_05195 [Methanocorpusculum sp. MG]|uniref:Uncharacterized protein n=1 Tax=Methanocorpusculum petauri TaxID=3002863 RepID=A0ABT4IFW7_9EURY|nr:hypothetical protein [Methanocorpusculum petauri]MCZ0860627.1 hypothetical protein [Methanocorpusculum petauri]MCZ9313475.1 hypothetical protein [Methanocorpusculum sp.]
MKNTHRNLWFVSALAVLLLLGAAVIPVTADSPASAETLFSIPGKTTLVSLSDNADVAAYSTTPDYGPLNIPSALLPQTNVRSATPAYQLASFDNVIPVRSNTVSLPITLYGQSYTIPLTRMTFESIDDGIDTYQGTVPGIADSLVIVTVADDNLFYGSITLPNDNIEIYPVQNYNYTQITPAPLHIIYSENSIPEPAESVMISSGRSSPITEEQLLAAAASSKNAKALAVVGFLVGTDEEFYYQEANWIGRVQQLLGTISYAYEDSPVGVALGVCAYDSSMMSVFSNDPRQVTDPLALAEEVYWDYFLEQKNADLALYVSGVDANGVLIAEGTTFPKRWAWAQMVDDDDATHVTGTLHAQRYAAINALGYTFGADPAYAYVDSSVATVMYNYYTSSSYNQLTFSTSVSGRYGDANHDNAARISANKVAVANHV